jgi:hypothetical protein
LRYTRGLKDQGASVTQQAVERAIGKLVTDAEFRERFYVNPEVAAWEAGLPLSRVELEALSALSRDAVTRFSEGLDACILRVSLDATGMRRSTERVSGEDTGTQSPVC